MMNPRFLNTIPLLLRDLANKIYFESVLLRGRAAAGILIQLLAGKASAGCLESRGSDIGSEKRNILTNLKTNPSKALITNTEY